MTFSLAAALNIAAMGPPDNQVIGDTPPRGGVWFVEETTVRIVAGLLCALVALVASALPGSAVAQGPQIESAFSDELISRLGLPLVEVRVGPDGIEAPDSLSAGLYHVRLSAAADYIGYVNIVQPPAGLDTAAEEAQMMLAGQQDLPQAGWTYFGGTNTPNPGEPASFVINLVPGDYRIAASYYSATDNGEDEVMRLNSLSVTGGASPVASPVASPAVNSDPVADVTLTMTDDLQYIISPEQVPTGPHIWKFENVGSHHAHHVVIFNVPDGLAEDAIIAEYENLMAGGTPAPESFLTQLVWSGYGALQSGGTVTWTEFNFQPGTYAAICFIFDESTGRPHVLDGMVTTFVVE
jgi:hypothetical protein